MSWSSGDLLKKVLATILTAEKYKGCWLSDVVLCEAMQDVLSRSQGGDATKCSKGAMNLMVTRRLPTCSHWDDTNDTGFYRTNKFSGSYYYFIPRANQPAPQYPNYSKQWKDSVAKKTAGLVGRFHRSESSEPVATGIRLESPPKRQRIISTQAVTPPDILTTQTWWDSPEAFKLFKPVDDLDTDVESTLRRRINKLKDANIRNDAWRLVVKGHDPDDLCSECDKFCIRQRCSLLCRAYEYALLFNLGRVENGKRTTWREICKMACDNLNLVGIQLSTNGRQVEMWNIQFIANEDTFPHPCPYKNKAKFAEPIVFQKFPEGKQLLQEFVVANLVGLNIEKVHDFVLNKLFPELLTKLNNDIAGIGNDNDNGNGSSSDTGGQADNGDADGSGSDTGGQASNVVDDSESSYTPDSDDDDVTMDEFKDYIRIKSFDVSTCWRWMKWLGMSYDSNSKTYYVDGHERESVVKDRVEFVTRYLTEYEPRCERWLQIKAIETEKIDCLNLEWGYKYTAEDGDDYLELHEDDVHDIDFFDDWPRKMSIRAPAGCTPILLMGQDEALFAQYLIPVKSWRGPKGEAVLNPKTEGEKFMLSGFVGRDTGFGRPLTREELLRINAKRQGADYIDTEAALLVHKTIRKDPFKENESPFVRYLQIGAGNEGYWNSYHMALQLEDVADCLSVIYPNHEVVMLFDHSQGHDRKRLGALTVPGLNAGFGGVQPVMRNSILEATDIGTFNTEFRLSAGEEQRMNWRTHAEDQGPFDMSTPERIARRQDQPTGKSRPVYKTKDELTVDLEAKGVDLQPGKTYTRKKLQEFASEKEIELKVTRPLIKEGWEGKPKGMLQILWERGWIDDKQLSKYSVPGSKDLLTGKVDESTSLRVLISSCSDFKNEDTALQVLGKQMGIKIDSTPKFHAELAGEGIEYAWGFCKALYRRKPLGKKRKRESFKKLVYECTDPKLLTPKQCAKFSRRARQYICAYYSLHLKAQQTQVGERAAAEETVASRQQLHFTEIEHMKKEFKSHRCALDFDKSFVDAVLKEVNAA